MDKSKIEKRMKKGARFLAHLWLYVVNYFQSSVIFSEEEVLFFFVETLTKIEATETINATIATIMVNEPSPKIEPTPSGAEVLKNPIKCVFLKVESPKSQSETQIDVPDKANECSK